MTRVTGTIKTKFPTRQHTVGNPKRFRFVAEVRPELDLPTAEAQAMRDGRWIDFALWATGHPR